MDRKLRIGLIGLGGIAHLAHFDAFGNRRECEITAGCDIDERKFKLAKGSIKNFYTSYREMLDKEDIDAVVVGTPNSTHVDIAIDALEAGVSVLCEKPVSVNLAEANRLKSAVSKSRGKLMIGQSMRFRPQTAPILDLVAGEKLGEIYYCRASYLRRRGIPGFGTWFTDKQAAGGGVVLDLGVHIIDYFWFLLGKPGFESVSAFNYGGVGKRILKGEKAGFNGSEYPSTYMGPERNVFNVEEMNSTLIRFKNGITLQMEAAWAMNIEEEIFEGIVYGDRGSVSIGSLKFTSDESGELKTCEVPFEQRSSYDVQAGSFISFLKGEIENPVPIEDALEVIKVLEAIYKSADEQREIKL